MLTLPPDRHLPSALLYGTDCYFTSAVLKGILGAGLRVGALALAGPPNMEQPLRAGISRPVITMAGTADDPASVVDIASNASVPTYRVGNLESTASLELVHATGSDYLLSVCFPRLIPAAMIQAFDGPALNVHPSLLPSLRGPDPMFWTFRQGDGRSGVTIHHLSDRFDAGTIAAQRNHTYEDGTSERQLEQDLANTAVAILAQIQPALLAGNLPEVEQQHDIATYAPFPSDNDFVVDTSWSARSAFNFIRGIGGRGHPVVLREGATSHRVRAAIGYRCNHPAGEVEPGVRVTRMSDGYILTSEAAVDKLRVH